MLARTEDEPDADLLRFAKSRRFATILADPPWQFVNRTGKMAPEHRRLSRYSTMTLPEICSLPILLQKSAVCDGSFGVFTWGDGVWSRAPALSTQLLRYAIHRA